MTKYTINQQKVRWRVVDGEAIVINVENSYYYSLNKTGTLIWQELLEQASSFEELTMAVETRYGETNGNVQSDVQNFLTNMVAENLITVSKNGG